MINPRLFKFIPIIALLYGTTCFAFDVIIISNKKRSDPFDQQRLVKILMAEELSWTDGKNILLLTSSLENISNEDFRLMTKRNKSDFLRLWRSKYFSGRAFIPTQINEDKIAFERVNNNSESLYISFRPIDQASLKQYRNLTSFKLSF